MTRTPITRRSSVLDGTSAAAKTLVLVGSMVVMLGGWGVLAAGQVQDAMASPAGQNAPRGTVSGAQAPTVPQVDPAPNLQAVPSAPQLRQVNPPAVQPRPFARSRSSR